MQNVTGANQKTALAGLASSDASAKDLFLWLSGRSKDSTETSIDRIMHATGLDRGAALSLMKRLSSADVADLYVGRRGAKTRLVWKYSCKSVGAAALEPQASLQIPSIEDEAADDGPISPVANKLLGTPIEQAKALLSSLLGVKPENIEIVIRA